MRVRVISTFLKIRNLTGQAVLMAQPRFPSPVARALLKAREGDVVQLRTPNGIEDLEILEVMYVSLE